MVAVALRLGWLVKQPRPKYEVDTQGQAGDRTASSGLSTDVLSSTSYAVTLNGSPLLLCPLQMNAKFSKFNTLGRFMSKCVSTFLSSFSL